jgi:hypothetical protein
MVGMGGILKFHHFEPGVLARGLIEVAVNTYALFQDLCFSFCFLGIKKDGLAPWRKSSFSLVHGGMGSQGTPYPLFK